MAHVSPFRWMLPRRIQALGLYRRHSMIMIKQGETPDLSQEVDLDCYHLDDFKLMKDQ